MDKNQEIFKKLKAKMNYIRNNERIEVFGAFYLSENQEYRYIIIPNYKDLILPEKLKYRLNNDNELIDIRDLIELYKARFNQDHQKYDLFYNLITTDYKILNKRFIYYKNVIGTNKEVISKRIKENDLTIIADLKEFINNICKEINIDNSDIDKNNKLDLNKYENIYFTSDTHFGHSNILNFEINRWNLINTTPEQLYSNHLIGNYDDICDPKKLKKKINDILIKEHDRELIWRWNEIVKEEDLVFILGDFSFLNAKDTEEILKCLKGTKVLIEGNHDPLFLNNKYFDRSLFKEIISYKEITYKGRSICLMHYPIMYFNHMDKPKDHCHIHLFGHLHGRSLPIPINSYNVGVDINNYYPIHIDKAIEKALSNDGGFLNGK